MRLVCISDTHNKHRDLTLPTGDVLIHAGDATMLGEEEKCRDFLAWFSAQPFSTKIFVPGNHDFWFEELTGEELGALEIAYNIRILAQYRRYTYTQENYSILGLPWSLPYGPWAYQKTEEQMEEFLATHTWSPDIVVSHGPAKLILDKTKRGEAAGSEALLDWIREREPKVVISGHIHEAYGAVQHGPTLFVNAALLNEKYQQVNAPWVLDIKQEIVVKLV